ncbi:hypothetical protein FACS189430_02680 [Bacteroidia bacterium]|nr:hypothetical protein FACS189430_02680 [Bacteroidia bacterium]
MVLLLLAVSLNYVQAQTQKLLPLPDSIQINMKTGTADTILYRHGFNHSLSATPNKLAANPSENIDSVMIGTKDWRYFVLPDSIYNIRYYAQYFAATPLPLRTDSTSSEFDWTFPNGARDTIYIRPNRTGTSTHVSINWVAKTAGVDTIRIVENAREYDGVKLPAGATCSSDTLKIPVQVIDRPNVMFDTLTSGHRSDVACAPAISATALFTYNFPLVATDSVPAGDIVPSLSNRNLNEDLDGIYIKYKVEKQQSNGDYAPYTPTVALPTTVRLPLCNVHTGALPLSFEDYGAYRVTIEDVSGNIAEKCNVDGLAPTAEGKYGFKKNQFTLLIINAPKIKDTNHVKNNR